MSTARNDHDGSDIFWPGYVDAVTNLVLNLLFLLTIMTVAVFMFALELGRASKNVAEKPPVAAAGQKAGATAGEAARAAGAVTADLAKENAALKSEIQRLNTNVAEAAQKLKSLKPAPLPGSGKSPEPGAAVHPGAARQPGPAVQPGAAMQPGAAVFPGAAVQPGPAVHPGPALQPGQGLPAQTTAVTAQPEHPGDALKTVEVAANLPKPQSGLDTARVSDLEVMVRFKDEAVAFSAAEHERLLETLRPIVATGKASINVEVPVGFSEAKRMGFYRAMAVRNLLIEMHLPKESITVAVVEGKDNPNASLVRVK